MRRILSAALVLWALSPLMSGSARADLFMNASSGGVTGDSLDASHLNWNEVLQVANRATQGNDPIVPPTAPLEDFRTFRVLKQLDSGSAKLRERLMLGTVFPSVVIEQTDPSQAIVWKIVLGNARVVEARGAGDDVSSVPSELVSFRFDTIEWTYLYTPPGQTAVPITRGWDLITHTEN